MHRFLRRLAAPALLLLGLSGLGLGARQLLRSTPFQSAPELGPLRRRPLPPALASRLGTQQQAWLARGRSQPARTPPLGQTVNLLLAGIDTRPDMPWGGRTDALLLLVWHEASGHVGLVSVPRDLVLDLPDHGLVRINTLYLRGSRGDGKQGGVDLLERGIRHSLGLAVHHVVFVEHSGFEQLVDGLGGVAVTVRCPIHDRFLDPRGADGRRELLLQPGVRWLDGPTALMFARSRHGRGTADRARRQQAVLLGIRDRLLQLGPRRVMALLPLLRRAVYTDLPAGMLLRLASKLQHLDRGKLHGLVLGWRHVEAKQLADGRRVMWPRPDAIHRALSQLFSAPSPGARRTRAPCPPLDVALEPRPARVAK